MANSVYTINKGIGKPIEFKGIKAQYLGYLGGGLVLLLVFFALMYLTGVNTYISLAVIVISGTGLFAGVSRLSRKYGEYGMMKKAARKAIPNTLKSWSRQLPGFRLIENKNKKTV